uniref:Uncharacterized protein n=1 Tax=Strigops habroptila TaxID=2489341 RepID=A0A672UJA7_STRHB
MRPALVWLILSLLTVTGAEGMCRDPPATPARSIPAPRLSAEEQLSPHMPESLRCDACHAIAFQLPITVCHPSSESPRPSCPALPE